MLPHLILAGRGAGQVLHCTWGLRGLGILRDLITQTAEEGQGQDWNPSPFDPDSRELLPPPRSASWGRGRLHHSGPRVSFHSWRGGTWPAPASASLALLFLTVSPGGVAALISISGLETEAWRSWCQPLHAPPPPGLVCSLPSLPCSGAGQVIRQLGGGWERQTPGTGASGLHKGISDKPALALARSTFVLGLAACSLLRMGSFFSNQKLC